MHGGVTAVIISFNGGQHTSECAASLAGQVDRLLIVDNGSEEASRSHLRAAAAEASWEVIWLASNLGIAAALNVGLKAARRHGSRWMLTMDQDSVAAPDMIAAFRRTLGAQPTAVSLAPAIPGINPQGSGPTMRYAITSGNLVRTDVAAAVGGYWEELFIDGVDLDFSLRLATAGHPIYRVPDAQLLHRLGERRSRIPFHSYHSPLRRYYIFRNYWALMRRHARNHPVFALRLTTSHVLQLGTVMLFGDQRLRSLRMISRGFFDAAFGRLGPLKA